MRHSLIILIAAAFFTGCITVKNNQLVTNSANNNTIVGGKLFTAVWQQRAAEYKALCEQAYNIATLRVQQYYNADTSSKAKAIVTDIDETFLNNAPYAVHQALQGKDFSSASWSEWTSRADADTLAGALAFFKFAASKGMTIFYVTNRNEADRQGTLKNLQKFGFPNADNEHLWLMDKTSSKEERRQKIAKDYDIVLLLGDNLGDFSALFDKKSEAERSENVLNNKRRIRAAFHRSSESELRRLGRCDV
ncbi:MAG: 5'-nucleotidase, lipoprotein e(P4) family [Arachidicoccus sp.]|nr:5'-nucleotidase, lipoprotein e(P4) family [Arachidicoccus sp.]